jgi:glycosyltransferase involved in cell wall biosynthesis
MRIGLVATGGFDRSGRERVIPSLLWLVERLAREHDVVVFTLRDKLTPSRYPLLGATVRDLGCPVGASRQMHALADAVASEGPFDLLHAYWAQPAGRLVVPLGRRLGLPTIATLDSGEFVSLPRVGYGLQNSFRGRRAVRTACAATCVTVCTAFQVRLAHEHGCTPRVIPLGVDVPRFDSSTPRVDGPPFRLLHVASLNRVKDQATLLRAFAQVARTHDVTLDVVGEDTMGGRLAALAHELRIGDRVTFHGFLPTDQLAPLYGVAHLFVLSSLHEAAGVVVLEAATAGVPVVGSSVGYLADWHPELATAVPPGDADVLADAIVALLADAPRRTRQAGRARAWAIAHDADWTAAQFLALYREAIAERGRPTRRGWRLPFISSPRS